MKLTSTQKEKIKNRVLELSISIECSLCSQPMPMYSQLGHMDCMSATGGRDHSAGINFVVFGCDKCGNVRFHDLHLLKLRDILVSVS